MQYDSVVKTVNEVITGYTIQLTVRQIYYRLISPPYQLFANTIQNYKALDRILTRAREKGDVDWRRIVDRSRNALGGDYGFNSPEDYVNYLLNQLNEEAYTVSQWKDQPSLVEIWVEKEGLALLFQQACSGFRVRIFPTRGYSSFTSVMEAIEDRFEDQGKPIIILHFSDHDPSGLNMLEDLESRFQRYGDIDLTMKRIALTYDQVQKYALASNPTKAADSRSPRYVAQYGNQCWEIDAVDPAELQRLIREAVEGEIDVDVWNETKKRGDKETAKIKEAIEQAKDEIDEAMRKIREGLNERG